MNPEKFTYKAQHAIGEAQQLAMHLAHHGVDSAHFLKALLEQDEDALSRWI
jgi:ATP-dependent Clp protease ATP-binding subunit ClpA